MHSEIDSLERIELIRQLRSGDFDILVGINLLREGLDVPEVSTIFILDADKEGFLRDERSLIQTIGRAARNINGTVILYANEKTRSIQSALEITRYRRMFQRNYNKKHNITPRTIIKAIVEKRSELNDTKHLPKSEIQQRLIELDAKMRAYAARLEFEKAIQVRDRVQELETSLDRILAKERSNRKKGTITFVEPLRENSQAL
jgi:excinuclease ABC subunit B